MQTLAGMDTGYGRTRETDEAGFTTSSSAIIEEEVGRFAARAAVQLFLDLAGTIGPSKK
jgi:cyanophycin synthetase